MIENERFLAMPEMCTALAGISKSTLRRRIKELDLSERGYVLRLGRRLLFSYRLITDLPALLNENVTRKMKSRDDI